VGDGVERGGEVAAAVAAAVVGQYPVDVDVVGGEERGGSGPERGCGGALFVVEDLAVGQAAVGVDRGVHERVPDLAPVTLAAHRGTAVGSPAATAWDAAQLLDVEVDQLARAGHLHAPDRFPRRPVEVVEPVDAMTGQDGVHGGGGDLDDARDAGRAKAPRAAQVQDAPLHRCLGPGGLSTRAAGTVLQAGWAFDLVAAPPDIGAVPGDPHRRRGVGDRPTSVDPLAQQQSTGRRQTSVTVQQSLRGEWVVSATPTLARRLTPTVDPVSKVHGHYS